MSYNDKVEIHGNVGLFYYMKQEGCLMTPKQEAFAIEYLKDKNATQAAMRAGYSKKTAASIAWELLEKPDIKQFIGQKQEEALKNATVTVDGIVEQLRAISANPLAKDSDRIRALELIGKYLGMFTERVEMKGQIDTAVTKLDGILKQLDV
jgi:phage terminase small subunit